MHSTLRHIKGVRIDNEYRNIAETLQRKKVLVVFFSRDLKDEFPVDVREHLSCNKSGKFIPLSEIMPTEGKFHEYLIQRLQLKFEEEPTYRIQKSKPKSKENNSPICQQKNPTSAKEVMKKQKRKKSDAEGLDEHKPKKLKLQPNVVKRVLLRVPSPLHTPLLPEKKLSLTPTLSDGECSREKAVSPPISTPEKVQADLRSPIRSNEMQVGSALNSEHANPSPILNTAKEFHHFPSSENSLDSPPPPLKNIQLSLETEDFFFTSQIPEAHILQEYTSEFISYAPLEPLFPELNYFSGL